MTLKKIYKIAVRGRSLLLYAYLLVLALLLTYPFQTVDYSTLREKIEGIKWIPFRDPHTGGLHAPMDMILNVILFLPFGVLLYAKNLAPPQYNVTTRLRPGFLQIAALAAITSLSFEFLQLAIVDRITNLSDVVNNTIGALLGASCVHLCCDHWSK